MSKSKGEFLTVSLLEKKGFNPLAYRYYVLNSHYRKQLAFSFESLKMASSAYQKLQNRVKSLIDERPMGDITKNVDKYHNDFLNYISDDLNTANAISILYDVLKAKNLTSFEKLYLVEKFDLVLSLGLLVVDEEIIDEDLSAYVEERISKRLKAKESKDYKLADDIREELKEKGIVIKDTNLGTEWEKI